MVTAISRRVARALVTGLVLAAAVPACSAGEDVAAPELREGSVRVTSRAQTLLDVSTAQPIKLGKNDLRVAITQPGVELTQASALMPSHGHGTRPPIIAPVQGGYEVRELVLYMSGRWELRLTLRHDGRDDEALLTIDVP